MTIVLKEKSREPEVRNRLLSAALELFTLKGYAATSVREIVEVAGVTKPVLYYYFGNKEGIYLALFREPFRLLDGLLDLYPEDGGICASDALKELCDRVFKLFLDNLDTARLMYSIYYGPPQGAPFFDFDGYHRKLQDKLRKLLEQGICTVEFAPMDAGDVMWIVLGVLNAAMEEQLCSGEKPGIDRMGLKRILSVVLGGFAGKRDGFPLRTS